MLRQQERMFALMVHELYAFIYMSSAPTKSQHSLKEALLNRRMLICIFNGFSSGMPLYYIYQLIPAWLRDYDTSLKTIGIFSLLTLPYALKPLWAPLLDRYSILPIGRRRGWMLFSQILLLILMMSYSFFEPQTQIMFIGITTFLVAFSSATQDMALDAYRRELLPDEELGLGNSFYMNAYRLSALIPASLGLVLADLMPWSMVHIIIGGFMIVGIVKTLMIKEITGGVSAPRTLKAAIVDPFIDFFGRDGFWSAILILAFVFFYKFGDTMATALITPFYMDVGFTKSTIGLLGKAVSLPSMIFGGFVGGLIMFKIGINRSLWVFGVVQMVSILGFAVLNEMGPIKWVLGIAIGFEYLGVGLGSAAFMAYIMRLTNKNFTASQLALFTSLFALPRSVASAATGFLIEGIKTEDGIYYELFGQSNGLGYTNFFIFCTFCALPGMALLYWVAPWNEKKS